ncbi:MAG: radical SAM protein [Desulfatitalea sp.]|nr:radical SAM protein [Desulfatitalea sp.]NNK01826.1 radical SAM protein [Desulfatitalea sp.]
MPIMVNEIFYSIQGESIMSGLPYVFVRLSGCNLQCRYCDTRHAWDEGTPWEIAQILTHIARYQCLRVLVTGGEPLLQEQTLELIRRLLAKDYDVSLETNGSKDISRVAVRCQRIMDFKCPSSGMQAHNRMTNLSHLMPWDQVKFVIADREDFDFACGLLPTVSQRLGPGQILFSPAHPALPATQLANWMLDAHVEARLQIQLHKYLWPNQERGV